MRQTTKRRVGALGLLALMLFLADQVFGQAGARLVFKETDGSPSVSGVFTVKMSNGSLTDLGGGEVQITTGTGSGTDVEVNTGGAQGAIDIQDSGTVTWSLGSGVLTATSSGSGGGDVGAAYEAAGSTTETATNTSTYVRVAHDTTPLSEVYDLGSNFTASLTDMEFCYPSGPNIAVRVIMAGQADHDQTGDMLYDMGVGVTPGDGNRTGTDTKVGTVNSAGSGSTPVYVQRTIDLVATDCVALLVKAEDTADATWRLKQASIIIDVDDNYTRAGPTEGRMDSYGELVATGGDGLHIPIALASQTNGGVWFQDKKPTLVHSDDDLGPDGGFLNYQFGGSDDLPGTVRGKHQAQVEIWNKNAAPYSVLDIRHRKDRGGVGAGEGHDVRFFDAGGAEFAFMGIGPEGAFQLEMLGYAEDLSLSTVGGFRAGWANSPGANASFFFAASSPATAGRGGGYCISSKATGSYADLAAIEADSICIALDESETATFAQGHPFLDENRDGIKNGNDLYWPTGASSTAVHLTFYMEGPVDGASFTDFDRVRSAFTAGNVYCKTDQGTIQVDIRKDDGTAADIQTSPMTCDSDHAGATTSSFVSGENVFASGDWIDIQFGTATGNPGVVTIIIDE